MAAQGSGYAGAKLIGLNEDGNQRTHCLEVITLRKAPPGLDARPPGAHFQHGQSKFIGNGKIRGAHLIHRAQHRLIETQTSFETDHQ